MRNPERLKPSSTCEAAFRYIRWSEVLMNFYDLFTDLSRLNHSQLHRIIDKPRI
jgi:hypothetical protein